MIEQNPMRCTRKVYDVKEWTIIWGIQLCPKKPTATAVAEKPTFDCVPKLHFLFVLSWPTNIDGPLCYIKSQKLRVRLLSDPK